MKDFFQDFLLCFCIIPLVLGMCLLYWLCRLFGVRLEDDF